MAEDFTRNLNFQSQTSRARPLGPWSELANSSGEVRPHWQKFYDESQKWTPEQKANLAINAKSRIKEIGTTYNVFSDAGGAEQPYQLDPIPLIISETEWQKVAEGIEQRARLLDVVLSDIYGAQKLLKEGLIPPDLVYSSDRFLHEMRMLQSSGKRYLHSYAVDLFRSPEGNWKVLRDHTRVPSGLGQVFENRKVISNLMGHLFDRYQTAPLGWFLESQGKMLQSLATHRKDAMNVVFLTPGFRHTSYFEHAYKARLLGISLVEPADLTVRERRVYLKTLGGLRRVDVVLSRIDDDSLDPLEQTGGGADGIAGLIAAWRAGNVIISNLPGSGFGSSIALMPFLPNICEKWLGEKLKLPFVESWWLGQAAVRSRVFSQLHQYILFSVAKRPDPALPLRCADLSAEGKAKWIKVIEARPYDFVVQAFVTPSEAPRIFHKEMGSSPVIWRSFALLEEKQVKVLPGGLAKLGKSEIPPHLWPNLSGYTKDVWISRDHVQLSIQQVEINEPSSPIIYTAQEVPSRIAEQLFWAGRYSERVELFTRLLRMTLRSLMDEQGRSKNDQIIACMTLLQAGGLFPEAELDLKEILPKLTTILSQLIYDPQSIRGIRPMMGLLLQNSAAARDRLSDDTWSFLNQLESIVDTPSKKSLIEMEQSLDQLILYLAAFSGMQAENMTRGQGWRFLEMGRRLERALGISSLFEAAAKEKKQSALLLKCLLETCDSVMTYRRRHFSTPTMEKVTNILFADVTNPRSLSFQIEVIQREILSFPRDPNLGLMPQIQAQADQIKQLCEAEYQEEFADFDKLSEGLEQFSDLLTQHFFSHSVRRIY